MSFSAWIQMVDDFIWGPPLMIVLVGACMTFDTVITFSDAANGLMSIPNLIALLLLAPVVVRLVKAYRAKYFIKKESP